MPNFFPTLGHQRKVRRDCVSTSWSTRKKRKSFFTFTVLCWAPEHRTTTKASRWRWPSPKNKARISASKCSYTRWERHRIKNLSVLEETRTPHTVTVLHLVARSPVHCGDAHRFTCVVCGGFKVLSVSCRYLIWKSFSTVNWPSLFYYNTQHCQLLLFILF